MSPERDDYLWDRSGEEDPEVARLEAMLGGLGHDAPMRPLAPRRRSRAPMIGAAIAVAAIAAAAIVLLLARREPGPKVAAGCADRGLPGFSFSVQGGPARCGGADATGGVLPIGAWLETAVGAQARVRIADIGDVTLLGDSKLRAVATGPAQQRLELARGTLRARVSAPPRLFVVDTPGAAAVDLGCAYELSVDERGRTRLLVTTGVVSLEGGGRSAYVPAGVEVTTVGGGPGTPVRSDTSPALRAAVARFDGGDHAAVADIVAAAAGCDTITLWNLLARTGGGDRRAVFDRLDALAIRPEWVLEDEVLAGQPKAIEDWRRDLDASWNPGLSPSAVQCTGAGEVDPHTGPPPFAPPPELPPPAPPGAVWEPDGGPAASSPLDDVDAAPTTWQ